MQRCWTCGTARPNQPNETTGKPHLNTCHTCKSVSCSCREFWCRSSASLLSVSCLSFSNSSCRTTAIRLWTLLCVIYLIGAIRSVFQNFQKNRMALWDGHRSLLATHEALPSFSLPLCHARLAVVPSATTPPLSHSHSPRGLCHAILSYPVLCHVKILRDRIVPQKMAVQDPLELPVLSPPSLPSTSGRRKITPGASGDQGKLFSKRPPLGQYR